MNKNKLIILGLFLIGLALRLYSAIVQPLWLDEIYSLYFANSYQPLNLIFHLPDTHPGFYYLLIKIILPLSTNTLLLRTITSIIPSLIGIYLLYRRLPSLSLLFFVLLNPFLIHQSWQLRSYGFTIMFSCLLISLFINYPQNFNFKKFILYSFLSTLFSFSLIIPTFCLCIFLFLKHKKYIYFIPSFINFFQFFILKGFLTYKNYAQLASWISPPSLQNFPHVILSFLGFSTDLNNLGQSHLLPSLIFIIIFTAFLVSSRRHQLFFFSFTLPLIITIIVSLSFPFLSQHFFFYHFIPKLSLFIPRFLLPLSIFFYLFLATKNRLLISIVFLLLCLKPFYKINIQTFYYDAKPLELSSSTLLLPPWENLRLNNSFTPNELQNISTKFDQALKIEKELLRQPHPDCSSVHQYRQVTYLSHPEIKSLQNYHQQIKTPLNWCLSQLPL